MGYGAADDIILKRPDLDNQRKKRKLGKVILSLFLLIILLGGVAGGYWYYINYVRETPKSTFFKYVGNNNFDNTLNIDVYYNMLNQIREKSFITETTANFTTTIENDLAENMDSSKLDFVLNTRTDRSNKKSLLDAKITYSSNDLFSLKVLNTNKATGIFSEDILDKYIASNQNKLDDSINRAIGRKTDISVDTIKDKFNSISTNRIEMDEQYKTSKVNEYAETVYQLIPEEAVTAKENVVVTINTETINTDAYTLNLENNEYKEILKTVLEKLKNDSELLNKIVTGEKNKNTIPNIQTKTKVIEGEVNGHETELEITSSPEMDLVDSENDIKITSIPEQNLVDETILDTTIIPTINIEPNEEKNDLYADLIIAFILGQKANGTVEDLITKIEEELKSIDSIKDGITITIYVRNEEGKTKETVKLVANLPEKTSLDLEYIGETKFKVTFLKPKEDKGGKEIFSGITIEIERQITDVNVQYNVQYSNIENKKVVSKAQIQLQTNNANISKGYTNNAIIKYNNNEGDLKVNIKNEIKFQEETIEEELTSENAIFVETLSDEEFENLREEIIQKVKNVYAEKLVSLTFINNNSSSSIIQQPVVQQVNTVEKEEIRNKLIETVSLMMGTAQQNGEEFTIQNLKDLSIDGYDVSSIVSSDLAIIKINGYIFNIDKDFMLSE